MVPGTDVVQVVADLGKGAALPVQQDAINY
jgi:hypothetical protein